MYKQISWLFPWSSECCHVVTMWPCLWSPFQQRKKGQLLVVFYHFILWFFNTLSRLLVKWTKWSTVLPTAEKSQRMHLIIELAFNAFSMTRRVRPRDMALWRRNIQFIYIIIHTTYIHHTYSEVDSIDTSWASMAGQCGGHQWLISHQSSAHLSCWHLQPLLQTRSWLDSTVLQTHNITVNFVLFSSLIIFAVAYTCMSILSFYPEENMSYLSYIGAWFSY